MIDDQHDQRPRSALQLAEAGLRRRDPAAGRPRISEADRLSHAELARQRAQLARRFRPNRFIHN